VTVPRYLLDTNICIYLRQERPSVVIDRFRKLAPGEAAISVISFGELCYGAEKSQDRATAIAGLTRLTSVLPVLPIPDAAGRTYGEIRRELEVRGEIISSNDLWIAAHARATGLILVTSNVREFKRVGGLTIENWASA
jgi:tRNA(fMet)-specific endonuclease VapC